MIKRALLLLSLAVPVFSQVILQSDPAPACLSEPTVKGSLTVTCVLADAASAGTLAGDSFAAAAQSRYTLWVRAMSTDADVVGVRITVMCSGEIRRLGSNEYTNAAFITRTVLNSSGPMTYVFSELPGCTAPLKIAVIKVDEVKASSSESF